MLRHQRLNLSDMEAVSVECQGNMEQVGFTRLRPSRSEGDRSPRTKTKRAQAHAVIEATDAMDIKSCGAYKDE